MTHRATNEICSISLRCIPVGRNLLEARLSLLVWWLSDIDSNENGSLPPDCSYTGGACDKTLY